MDRSVGQFELRIVGENEPLKAVPVMRWTHEERDPLGQGLGVLWIGHGRPYAVASIYPWKGQLMHEFDAVSAVRVEARRGGELVWQPNGGVGFQRVPDASAPAASAAERLRQMKSLAEQFSATMLGWKPNNSDREELRLRPRPVFRYEPDEPKLMDGAVFAFCMGTDPEALLIIEAVRDDSDSVWQYAFIRQTSGALQGRHQGRVVWTAEKFPVTSDASQLHRTVASDLDFVTTKPPDRGQTP